MNGNWWFKAVSTALSVLLALSFLVFTVGGWSTQAEVESYDARTAELKGQLEAAQGDKARVQAQKTLDDHEAKRAREAPAWAHLFPGVKINLGLDLQGGIDLELGVDIRKAVEAAADRYAKTIVDKLADESLVAKAHRLDGSATILVNVKPDKHTEARDQIVEHFGIFTFLGLQEHGGEQWLAYEFEPKFAQRLKSTALQQAVETIRDRVDKFGVTEPSILTKGEDGITVQLPGLDDPQRAIDLVGKTAQLEFRMLYKEGEWSDQRVAALVDQTVEEAGLGEYYTDEQLNQALKGKIPEEAEILHKKVFNDLTMRHERKAPYLVNKTVELTGEFIDYAHVATDRFNVPYVSMELNATGARIFSKLSGDNVGKRMAIVLDGNVASAPVFKEKIGGGRASITLGDSDSTKAYQEADDLVVVLRAGALPAPIEILHNRTVGQTLGKDSIAAGSSAAAIAGLLVLLFMWLYYRGAGIIANIAVALNMLFLLALLAAFGATLTLPGIAGIILTIGMAVDASLIIFERIREELTDGKSVRASISAGYDKATWTVLDANITTFLTGAVLYSYGTGPVKGFAVTLMVGIFTSVMTALVVTRLIFDYLTDARGMRKLSIGL